MKFTLVENINEEVLNEDKHTIKSLINSFSDNTYNPKGFWSQYNPYKQAWVGYIYKYYHIDVTNWHVHHINAIHKNLKQDKNNTIDNLAFVDIHSDITKHYVEKVKEKIITYVKNNVPEDNTNLEIYFELIKDSDLFDLLVATYKNLVDNKINPSTVFRINLSYVKNIVNSIPNMCSDVFTEMLQNKETSQHILLFNTISGIERLMSGEKPPEEE